MLCLADATLCTKFWATTVLYSGFLWCLPLCCCPYQSCVLDAVQRLFSNSLCHVLLAVHDAWYQSSAL